jgi:hypothetical protein
MRIWRAGFGHRICAEPELHGVELYDSVAREAGAHLVLEAEGEAEPPPAAVGRQSEVKGDRVEGNGVPDDRKSFRLDRMAALLHSEIDQALRWRNVDQLHLTEDDSQLLLVGPVAVAEAPRTPKPGHELN